MEDSRRHIRLGLFIVASLSLLAVALGVFGWRMWFEPTFTFETYFDHSIAGLAIGAQTSFRGVPMGQVTEILTSAATYERNTPSEQRRNYIVVRVKTSMPATEVAQMKRDFGTLIKQGLRAQTQLAGITGQQYLELDFLQPTQHPPLPFAWQPEYTYLPSVPSIAGDIISKVQSFLASLDDADISALSRNLNALVRNLDTKLEALPVAQLSASAEAVLHNAAAATAQLDMILKDPSLDETLDNAAAFTGRLRRLADDGDFDRMIQRIDAAAGELGTLLGDNQYDVGVLVQDLRVITANLRGLSETVKSDPAIVLFGRPPDPIKLPRSKP